MKQKNALSAVTGGDVLFPNDFGRTCSSWRLWSAKFNGL